MKKIQLSLLMGTLLVGSQVYAVDDSAIKVKWGYRGNISAVHWGSLNSSFALCAQGKEQSPIDITGWGSNFSNPFTIAYQTSPMNIVDDGTTELMIGRERTIINDGHGVQLNFPASNVPELVTFNGKTYRLVQFHIHTPSENKVNGQVFPMEIHFVHQGDNGELLVIGVFVKTGEENRIINKIITNLPKEEGKVEIVQGESINPADLLPKKHDFYKFVGSLTTPPCSEGLQWIVMAEPITASAEQIAKLKEAANGANARPVQPLNQRKITYIANPSSTMNQK